jgi:class 3 adenylate cyclase/TolB-like protein
MSETRKLAAILVSDVVGYSLLAGADEDRILARFRTLRSDLIDPTISVHHGRVVKHTGDGSIAEFRSVVDAVRCAIEVQSAMVERNAGVVPDKRIEFRIGVHLGDVVEEADGDLMGEGVNIAARLQGIAAPGAICLSEDAYRQVKGRLDLAVADLGRTQLKNIAEPIRVYSLQVGLSTQAGLGRAVRPAPPKARSALAPLVAGIVALLILLAGGAWHFFGASGVALIASNPAVPAAAARLSIVVLPFANLGDPAQDYLGDALTDALTTSLARIPGSSVIARDTAFAYKGKPVDAKAIGKDLGVRYVLEGSVLPSSNQVRVKAQLIQADSGTHLWADQFDTPRGDLLSTQDEIIARLVRAMDIQLTQAEAARLEQAPLANQDAEDLALRCRAAVRQGKTEAGFAFCEQALAIEPNNVHALVWLAPKFYLPAAFGSNADPEGVKRADILVSKALVVDPNYGHGAKGEILRSQGRLDEAIREFRRALDVDPTNADAIEFLGNAYWLVGEFEKSLEYFDKAIRLGPQDPNLYDWYQGKARAYFGLKNYDQAIEWSRRTIAINQSRDATSRERLIAALALAGHDAEAHEELQVYLALPGVSKTIAANRAAAQARFPNQHPDPRFLDYLDRFYEGLRKAGMPDA